VCASFISSILTPRGTIVSQIDLEVFIREVKSGPPHYELRSARALVASVKLLYSTVFPHTQIRDVSRM
jgi:hypothetical protein